MADSGVKTAENSPDFEKIMSYWVNEQADGSFQYVKFFEVKDQVKNIEVKEGDVWIVTFPKSGTTWMQELVWLLTHNLDYEGAKTLLKYRSPGLDAIWTKRFNGDPDDKSMKEFLTNASMSGGRRVIKSHLRFTLIPDKVRDPKLAKVIYVARNPKDVCVSYYYFHMLWDVFRKTNMSLTEFTHHFLNGKVGFGPYWLHVKEFWAARNDPNVYFVMYEDMKKDLEKVVREVATFLEEPIPVGEQMTKLLNHLSFESMKKNPALNRESGEGSFSSDKDDENTRFIRKGKVGDWKEKLSPELIKKFDEWIEEHFKDTDIKFVQSE